MLNSLEHFQPVSVGLQWALFVPTDVDTGVYKGARCVYDSSRLPFAQRLVRDDMVFDSKESSQTTNGRCLSAAHA